MPDFYDDRLLSSLIERNPVTVPPFTSTTQANAVGTPTGRLIDPASGLPLPGAGKNSNGVSLVLQGSMPIPLGGGISSAVYASYARTRTKFAAVKAALAAGTSGVYMDFALSGDSTTAGFYSVNSATNFAACRQRAASTYLAQALSLSGIFALDQSNFADHGETASSGVWATDGYDTQMTINGPPTIGSLNTLGGVAPNCGASGQSITYAPYDPCDSFDIYYPVGPTLSSTATISMTGASSQVLSNNAASNGMRKATIVGTLGASLTYAWTSGTNNFFTGVVGYRSDRSGVRVQNWGQGKATSANLADTTNPYSSLPAAQFVAPTLCLINGFINDWHGAVGSTVTAANLQAMITALLPTTDIIIQTGYPSAQSDTTLAAQKPYIDAIKAVAAANNLLCIDMWTGLGSQEKQAGQGVFNNILHPQYPLYQLSGNTAACALFSIGV